MTEMHRCECGERLFATAGGPAICWNCVQRAADEVGTGEGVTDTNPDSPLGADFDMMIRTCACGGTEYVINGRPTCTGCDEFVDIDAGGDD